MRMDQYVGLSYGGQKFLEENAEVDHFQLLKNGEIVEEYTEPRKTRCGQIEGAFGNDFPIFEYSLKDGSIVYEFVQASPWSSGPVYFIALSYDEEAQNPVAESLWYEEEMGVYV